MLTLDHLAVTAASLDDAIAHIEAALGVAMTGGGKHPHFATHNRLLGAGDIYLEAIATDPAAPKPQYPRWFDLDNFSGPAALNFWVARCENLNTTLIRLPGYAPPLPLSRGAYRWLMATGPDGSTPMDGSFPALIQWQGPLHPSATLPETQIRLTRLEIAHPDAATLRCALNLTDPRIQITQGPHKALRATFTTPHGLRTLC